MSSRKGTETKAMSKVPEQLANYMAQMKSEERALLEAIFQSALLEAQEIEVIDIWNRPEIPVTYWVLLLSGINQEEELQIAHILLSWQAFFSKHTARAICIQSSEREEFRCCSATFEVVNCPTLIFSDSPDMQYFVKVDAELLFKLIAQKGGLQRFLTKVHSLVENGETLVGVKSLLLTEKFWSALKIVYNEAKGLISFTKGF